MFLNAGNCRISSWLDLWGFFLLLKELKSCVLCVCSINTLVKISKSAGAMLKPHAPKLIPALLESLSVLEPQVLNYLSLRATDQEKVSWQHKRVDNYCERRGLLRYWIGPPGALVKLQDSNDTFNTLKTTCSVFFLVVGWAGRGLIQYYVKNDTSSQNNTSVHWFNRVLGTCLFIFGGLRLHPQNLFLWTILALQVKRISSQTLAWFKSILLFTYTIVP